MKTLNRITRIIKPVYYTHLAVNEALQQTDELDNLLIQLRNRAVRFSYRKQDGTLRELSLIHI